MTFSAQTAYADLYATAHAIRDNITSAANWSITTDHIDSVDSNNIGGYMVLTGPYGNNWLFVWRPLHSDLGASGNVQDLWAPDNYFMDNNEEVGLAFGSWDGANLTMGENADGIGYDRAGDWADSRQLAAGDDMELTMQYGNDEWCFYVRRTMGDGYNNDAWIGYTPINKMWDYTTLADADPYEFTFAFNAGGDQRTVSQHLFGFQRYYQENYINGSNKAVNWTGQGLLNPDSSVNNFPWIENILMGFDVENSDTGAGIPMGTFDTWLSESSGSSTALGDTIQDANGNNIFMVCKQYGSEPVLIKM